MNGQSRRASGCRLNAPGPVCCGTGSVSRFCRGSLRAAISRFRPLLKYSGVLMVLLAATYAVLVLAYNPEQDNVNGPISDRWQGDTVAWNLNPAIGSNVNVSGGDSIQIALTKSFNSWKATELNGQLLTSLAVNQGPNSSLTDPNFRDCLNVVSFVPSSSVNFPTGTIAFTQVASVSVSGGAAPFTYNCAGQSTPRRCDFPACIADADIVFNPRENFSTTTPPLAGDFDVQSVATHEIGHMLGLDHSGIASTVMDPFGDTGSSQQRNLALDDTIGIAFLYPAAGFSTSTGIISGAITQNGTGLFGSHVVAVNVANGVATVDGLTDPQGNYSLVGIPPGAYTVLAIPLSGVYDMSNFGGWYCGYSPNSQPCCNPSTDTSCSSTQALPNPTNYTGKFY